MFPKFRISAIAVGLTTAMLLSGCGGGDDQRETRPSHPVDRISRSADTMLMTDLIISAEIFDPYFRIRTNCSGATCSFGFLGEQQTMSVSDFADESDGEWPSEAETYRGVSTVRASAYLAGTGSMAGYGGWLDHNFFLVIHGTTRDDQAGDVSVPVAVSIGVATGTNPTSISGTATWSGIMIGTDVNVTTTPSHLLRGDADITIADFMNPSVDVAFTNIRNLNTGDIRNDMTWNGIPLTAGGFRQGVDEDSIQGAFFGPNHGEVGGVFERDQVIGAFGAARQ